MRPRSFWRTTTRAATRCRSPEDLDTTRTLQTALQAVGIVLADHIIVADDDFVSLADDGYLGGSYGL